MARRRERPIRLSWDPRPAPAGPPARLRLHSLVPPVSDGLPEGRLVQGDNLAVGQSLLPELEGRVDLVYLDPPFGTGNAYDVRVGVGEDSRRPDLWRTRPGYDDRWDEPAAYLEMLRPRLELVHRLLAATGTLYVHLDWRTAPYVRVLLDEIFGPGRLLNEIVWVYHGPSPIRTAFSRKHDTILAYTRSTRYTFDADAVRTPYDPSTWKTFAGSPRAGFGKVPDLERGKVPEDWWYFPVVARLHRERTGYPTQKPEALLDRIIRASSRPGDLVADLFCGAGTTPVVARRLGRRWLACDVSPTACATTYRRLLLDEADGGFSFWTDGPSRTRSLRKFVCVGRREGEIEIGLRSEAPLVWFEVDWDFDGTAFRSQSRAARAWRSEATLGPLRHHYGRGGRRKLAVRGADAEGTIHLSVLTTAT